MQLTNYTIYDYALSLNKAFDDNAQKLPMKFNFYLQKNKKILTELASDIEASRIDIIQTYGKLTEDGAQYMIPKDQIEIAQKELEDLLALEQEVNIYMINPNDFTNDINLTTGQMEAIMFMIE